MKIDVLRMTEVKWKTCTVVSISTSACSETDEH